MLGRVTANMSNERPICDMCHILDIPAMAIEVLRRYMKDRAQNNLSVNWYYDGQRCTAEPRPDKYEHAWIVSWNRWEGYHSKDHVLAQLDLATTFELV